MGLKEKEHDFINEKIIDYEKRWLDKYTNCESYNSITQEEAQKVVNELYEIFNFKKPKVILLDSPLACLNFYNENNKPSYGYEAGCYYNKIRNGIIDILINFNKTAKYKGSSSFEKDIAKENYFQRYFLPRISSEIFIKLTYHRRLGNSLFNIIFDHVSEFFDLNEHFFYLEENLVSLDKDLERKIKIIKKYAELFFSFTYSEKYCIVSKFPSFVSLNDENEHHNLSDYAVKFADGYGLHFFHNRFIEPELFNKLINKQYTFEDWSKESDGNIKEIALDFYNEKFGDKFANNFLMGNIN